MKKVLLHICCGVCAFTCIKVLREKNFYVEGFFYNPNITDSNEYLRRRDAAIKVCEVTAIKFHEGIYKPQIWRDTCSAYKNDPEGGKRCNLCYEFRLKETFHNIAKTDFDFFASTLSISPHKNSQSINGIGLRIAPAHFLAIDFKKNNGFKETMKMAKEHNIYRQNYCGCLFSMR